LAFILSSCCWISHQLLIALHESNVIWEKVWRLIQKLLIFWETFEGVMMIVVIVLVMMML
jgi:hypothetical protein